MSVAEPVDSPTINVSEPRTRTRLKRLRLAAVIVAVLILGGISFIFGLFVEITSELPSLTRFALYKEERSSVLLDNKGQQIGILSPSSRVIVTPSQIPPIAKEAAISIEDKRFWTEGGVDPRGMIRALAADITHGSNLQGGSTIEEQFIKNALSAQSHRTILEKLREAALAYQLSQRWSKQKILAAYLNTVYFGNGAYGIEAAAQTYFGHEVNHLGCGTAGHKLCVEELEPWEAALLAGMVQDPSGYNPVYFPKAAKKRRDVVLEQMYLQGYISKSIFELSLRQALPAPAEIQQPQLQTAEGSNIGYFSDWVQQQVVERYGAPRAYAGGLQVKTTLNLPLQHAAEQAVASYLGNPAGPTASMVVIENSTGAVRAMVGGRSYAESSFNIATQGERQPGSSFKVFDLAAALKAGISLGSSWPSKEKVLYYHGENGLERFVVHNDEGSYTGSNTLMGALTVSDNSIFAEVGLHVGTVKIAQLAHEMGISTPLSTNAAMTIGGLKVGVTPLDMAHAYETIAEGGKRISGSLSAPGTPVGIQEVHSPGATLPDGSHVEVDHVTSRRVFPDWIAKEETEAMETVVQDGTGTSAQIGQFAAGKTGTTTNFGDAWFVGFNSKYTVAVWVGFPNKLVPMTTYYNGGPVFGGTFPALIWKDFMLAAMALEANHGHETTLALPTGTPTFNGSGGHAATESHNESHEAGATPKAPAPEATKPAPTPTPTPTPTETGGGAGGGGGTTSGGVGAAPGG